MLRLLQFCRLRSILRLMANFQAPSPSPNKAQSPNNWWLRGAIARSVGITAIALGFVIGMYGLDHPASQWLPTALGLLVTGMMAQGYGLYCSVKRMQQPKSR